jgi:ferredoxin
VECRRSGLTVPVGPDTSVLEAVEAAGLSVPSSCRDGICGTCETRVLAGTPDHRDFLLSEAEHSAGETMMICVSRCASDRLVLDL